MKWLSAGLTFVNFATICGLLLGMVGGGLSQSIAVISLSLGAGTAILAYLRTSDSQPERDAFDSAPDEVKLSERAQRRLQRTEALPAAVPSGPGKYRNVWKWIMAACFGIFAFRSFCWLLFIEGEQLQIQSPNNLGDLALHITYIRNFANGVPLWPQNPIYVFSNLRYPAGTDLFNALLCLRDVDLITGLAWMGLLGSVATFYAFYRWGGPFGVAGFLFNGGVAGFQFFSTFKFLDYQGDKAIAWKSVPLAMLVTQRGLLYAIPAGLLLLWHWREKYFRNDALAKGLVRPIGGQDRVAAATGPLPFWVELSLYASMPLFHVHTFMALSIVLVFLFVFGNAAMRIRSLALGASAFIPATFFVWLISDHFQASSVLKWWPGWVLHEKANNDLARPFFEFWFVNFGLWIPLAIVLLSAIGRRVGRTGLRWGEKAPQDFIFVAAATSIFLLGLLFKFAPWEWDNLKLMIWGYFLVLPFLWSQLIARWEGSVRATVYFALFASGFISLFGGLAAGRTGFGFADRGELDGVGLAVRKLPVEARFAAYPTYNHPLLLQGRKVVLGYPGHLWTQGFDNYGQIQDQLGQLMQGAENWRDIAHTLRVRYVFWGREEKANYSASTRPWEQAAALVSSGDWGAIYDLEQPHQAASAQ